VAETLETGDLVAPVPRPKRAPPPVAVGYSAPAARRVSGLPESMARALDARRLIVLLPFAMIAGLIACLELPEELSPPALIFGGIVVAVLGLIASPSLAAIRAVACLAAFWLGLCLFPIHGALFGTAMLSRPMYGSYQAQVDEIVSESPGAQRVIVSGITPTDGDRPLSVRRARVLVKDGPNLAPGDVIAGRFRFAPVPGPVYPGGFDTQFHSYFDGIGAYGNSIKPPALVSTGSPSAPARLIDGVRQEIAARVDAVLAQPAAGVARAIINGDESAVTDDARNAMATAGIAHVLSVSGLHLTIVAGGTFWLLRLLLAGFTGLGRYLSVKRVAAAGGMASALFYYGISGGNVAALRSTLMILLVFGAVLVGRRAITMRNVAVAALIVIATDPAGVFRPSFQLSFAAVVALVGAYENLRTERAKNGSFFGHAWAYAKGIVVTSLIAGAATVLFSVYHFQQTSPLGVVGNLATLPLVGFVMMPAAAIAVLLMPLGLEAAPLRAMGWSIDRMLDMAHIVAGWSTHLRAAPLLTPAALIFGLLALGWFAFFKDRWRLLGPALALPLVLLFAVDRPPDALISDTTQAMVVRGPTGLERAAGKAESFGLDVWRATYGDPMQTQAAESCDSIACIGTSSAGFSYAIIRDPAGFADECATSDLIVTRLTAPTWCGSKAVIDAPALSTRGVHWVRWDATAKSFEVREAIAGLDHPWRIKP